MLDRALRGLAEGASSDVLLRIRRLGSAFDAARAVVLAGDFDLF